MSADYDEQPGDAKLAIDTFVPLLRRGPVDARNSTSAPTGGPEPERAQGAPRRIVEVGA